MLLRGVGDPYECVRRNLGPPSRMGQEGPRPFAPRMAPWWTVRRKNWDRAGRRHWNKRARLGSRDSRIVRRYFEQDLLPAQTLPHSGAAIVALAVVIVAAAVLSLRI